MSSALFFLGLNSSQAQESVEIDTREFSEYWSNCSNEENIEVNGTILVVEEGKGKFSISVKGTGYGGSSRANYVFNSTENFDTKDNSGTWAISFTLEAGEDAPDTKGQLVAYYNLDQNGNPVINFYEFKDICNPGYVKS